MKLKHDDATEMVVSVGEHFTLHQTFLTLKPIFAQITKIVADPLQNHFSIVITPLRKGSKALAKKGVVYKTVPIPPSIPKKKKKEKSK